jgi:hypothetical protein
VNENVKMCPFCKNPDRVLLHLLMVGLLSQVMDKANVNVVNKNIEPVCAHEVKDNVGVLAVLAMHSVNVNKNIEVMSNVNVNNVEIENNVNMNYMGNEINVYVNYVDVNVNNVDVNKVNVNIEEIENNVNVNYMGNEINVYVNYVDVNNVDVNKMNVNIELTGARAQEVKICSEMPPREVEKVKNKLKVGVLALLAMLDVIREGDIVEAPRLNRTHQEEGEDGKGVKKVKLDKVKTTDQTDSDSNIIWFVQETGDTLEKEKVKRVTGDAFDNEDTSENEIKNISEEEAGFEDASEDPFDDEDTGEDEIKNICEEEAGFEDTFEDAFNDEDTGEDEDNDDSKNSETPHDP